MGSILERDIEHVFLQVNGGQFDMNLTNKQGYIYIKNNGQKHPSVFTRAFGAYNAGKIRVSGRPLTRTWSLLSDKAAYGMSSIRLLHKPEDMVRLHFSNHFLSCSLHFRAGEWVTALL